ncbi:hypothetical protein BDZ94DRAFT_1254353 [Collybia nuda]|uniref:Nucleolar protein 12 n=1 Tax=Collybia nuda TaxID=64659 RepID=A0A9P5YBG4_9AGAR|nr:hypothetical protein BDZ94DRAFT_1254353 [Collybia nuda]
MSLSSLLISGGKSIDSELNALFTTTPAPAFRQAATVIPTPGSSKDVGKKRKFGADKQSTETPLKRSKSSPTKAEKRKDIDASIKPKPVETIKVKKTGKKAVKGKGKSKEDEVVDGEDENSDLENAYLQTHKDTPKSDNEDELENEKLPVHESLQKEKKSSRTGPKVKFVPLEETPEQRDQRTIFIGNLSIEVAQKRPLLKRLQRHILAQLPSAKIESTRFRSIPFQAPTSKLPASDDEEDTSKPKTPTPAKQARAHDRERASTWRDRKEAEEDEEIVKNDDKKFLNPGQKKKIAFINQEFHSTADTANAYVVFAHPLPAENRPSNLPPPPPTMDPYEAAKVAVEKCNGTLFMERMIRVDLVNKKGLIRDAKVASHQVVTDTDPKLSVFVGNLDFASKEEDLRVFFEGVVSAERGPPEVNHEEGSDGVKKPSTWVTRVRIVRDKDTQLGKGFAYIQFADHECVDEVLALDAVKLKFAKRKLRVQRCKTIPGSSTSTRQVTTDAKSNKPVVKPVPTPIIVPKGDPKLGEKLVHMEKDARKQYKSADADRVARRLAKKKSRIAMGNHGIKTQGKDRERVRKTKTFTGKVAAPKKGGSKGRVRSDKSLAKRNAKK